MSRPHPLLNAARIDGALRDYLRQIGDIFRIFDRQDSGCVSYGVRIDGREWFVKHSDRPAAIRHMRSAAIFHQAVDHPRIPKLLNAFHDRDGYAQVYEWADGEVLYSPEYPGREGRNHPASAHRRFRQLPPGTIVFALNAVYETHAYLEQKGYVAVDFYDGCMIYDFARNELRLCDFDHYHPGPFTLDAERNYGSSRFMAPEEYVRGSRIDRRTNVFAMGAAAFVFLADDGSREECRWQASQALRVVAGRAVSPNREARYDSVQAFYRAWLQAQRQQQ